MSRRFTNDNDRALALYCEILEQTKHDLSEISVVLVQHILPNIMPFIESLDKFCNILAIFAKPKSINENIFASIQEKYNVSDATKESLKDNEVLNREVISILPENNRLIIIDIGGYFAASIPHLSSVLGDRFLGIIEDTENGHQKYQGYLEKVGESPRSIYSVARSPLKEPEDHLVGQAVVYSTENVLRANGALLTNKIALVIGYGKIGKSVAETLSRKNLTVWVYDIDPIRRAQAASHGFATPSRAHCLAQADLIIGATGNKSLRRADFDNIKNGCFIASVTSSDDEFDFGDLYDGKKYNRRSNGKYLDIFSKSDRKFYLVFDGNAVNFLHGAVLGPYIYMVSSEIIGCIHALIDRGVASVSEICVLSSHARQKIAGKWLKHFLDKESQYATSIGPSQISG